MIQWFETRIWPARSVAMNSIDAYSLSLQAVFNSALTAKFARRIARFNGDLAWR
jgi:hypothetical protein